MVELTNLQRSTLELVTIRTKVNPITGKEIANRIGLKPRSSGVQGADMRSIIHALRVKGYPVCATGGGYWWPQNGDELKAHIESLEGRANQILEAVEGLKLGYSVVGGAKGVEAVKKAAKVRFSVKKGGIRTVVEISEFHIEAFQAEYPDAERV